MSAFTRTVFGLWIGTFFVAACSEENPSPPALLKQPLALTADQEAFALGSGVTLEASHQLELALGSGLKPQRKDALTFEMRCREQGMEEAEPAERRRTLPWTELIPLTELLPLWYLQPQFQDITLSCLLDLKLQDDEGHINYQKDLLLFVTQLGNSGSLQLLEESQPGSLITPENLSGLTVVEKPPLAKNDAEEGEEETDDYELSLPLPVTAPLEILCSELGGSTWGSPAAHLSGLLQSYLKEIEGRPSRSNHVSCRIFTAGEGELKFTSVFTLVRPLERPLKVQIFTRVEYQRRDIDVVTEIELENPNPFAVEVFLGSGKLWENYALGSSLKSHSPSTNSTTFLEHGPQNAAWEAPKGAQKISTLHKGKKVTGHALTLKARGQTRLVSRNRGANCQNFNGLSRSSTPLGSFVQPASVLPIWISYPGRLGAAISLKEEYELGYLYAAKSPSQPIHHWELLPLTTIHRARKSPCTFKN